MPARDKTLDLLEQFVAAQPGNWEARLHLAALHLDRNHAGKADEILSAGGPCPGDVRLRLEFGDVLARIAPDRALAHFQEMVRADRACARAYLGMARTHRLRDDRREAKRYLDIATVIDESLEDPDLRAWAEGAEPAKAPPASPPAPAPRAEADGKSAEAGAGTAPPDGGHGITFADVGGMEDVKERIRMTIIHPFKNPALFEKFKRRPGGGILLYGPPGCGKTYLARATAGECQARFFSIGITDILSRYVGESERRLHEMFDNARRLAPSVVFLDELDALGMSRHEARGTGMTTTINQLLTELDGVAARNENLLVLAATNAPWGVDSAFRRPGRFDRVIYVPPPDDAARRTILDLYLRDVPHDPPDCDALVAATRTASGADIRAVVERAAEQAIAQEMRSGRPARITTAMLLSAARETKPSTLEWLETAKNYATYANRAGQYDDLVQFFERQRT